MTTEAEVHRVSESDLEGSGAEDGGEETDDTLILSGQESEYEDDPEEVGTDTEDGDGTEDQEDQDFEEPQEEVADSKK